MQLLKWKDSNNDIWYSISTFSFEQFALKHTNIPTASYEGEVFVKDEALIRVEEGVYKKG